MEGFSFMPEKGDAERVRVILGETRVWWVELRPICERLFCDKAHLAAANEACRGVPALGLGGRSMVVTATDRPDVWALSFPAPLERMAVEHQWMGGWMQVLRANGCHGRYREAGTERWYEF